MKNVRQAFEELAAAVGEENIQAMAKEAELCAEGGAALQQNLEALTSRVSRAVACLREWQALEYTGHFIDLHPEMKERVASVARRTDEVLREWKLSIIKPEPSSVTLPR